MAPCQEARAEHGLGLRNLFMKTHFLSASVWLGGTDVLLMYRYDSIVHYTIWYSLLASRIEIKCCWLKFIVQTIAPQRPFSDELTSFHNCSFVWWHGSLFIGSALVLQIWPLELCWHIKLNCYSMMQFSEGCLLVINIQSSLPLLIQMEGCPLQPSNCTWIVLFPQSREIWHVCFSHESY